MEIYKKHIAAWVIVMMLMGLFVPISGIQKSYAGSETVLTESIELVNLPENGEVLLGLDEWQMFDQLQVKIKLKDGRQKIVRPGYDGSYDYESSESIYMNETNHVQVILEYNQNEEGMNGELKEGDNNITARCYEYTTVLNPNYDPDADYEEEKYMPKLLNTLETSFAIKGVVFENYDPPLENDKAVESEISQFGNAILFSNKELWKAPTTSVRYSKKDNMEGIAKNVYNNMYLDTSGELTVENPKGKKILTFNKVKDFRESYILQDDGTLTSIERYYGDEEDWNKGLDTQTVATDVDVCRNPYHGCYYTITKSGKPTLYELDDFGEDGVNIKKVEMDDVKAVNIVDNPSLWEGGMASYLTEDKKLKTFWLEFHSDENGEKDYNDEGIPRNKLLRENIESMVGNFAIGTDGKTYSVVNGEKLLDTKIIDVKQGYSGVIYAGDDQGHLYIYDCGGRMERKQFLQQMTLNRSPITDTTTRQADSTDFRNIMKMMMEI